MSMLPGKVGLLVTLACTPLAAMGARISVRTQLDAGSVNASLVGAKSGESWTSGKKYACMQKWQTSGFGQARFVDKYCLADLKKALDIVVAHRSFAADIEKCQVSGETHNMQICTLKGEKPDGRLSYSSKTSVAKLCLRPSSATAEYPIVEAALHWEECESRMKLSSVDLQGKFAAAITTTTTTSTTTTAEEDVYELVGDGIQTADCDCDDGFLGALVNGECTCRPAPCDVVGSVNKGPDCQCMPGLSGDITWYGSIASGECIIDARDLFRDGAMKVWEYKGKAIKCCVPTVVAPTELQDMNAEQLPSQGMFGRAKPTGCGYMFGAHYHNGMKPYKARAEPTCPVSIAKLIQITGETLEEIKVILNLDKAA